MIEQPQAPFTVWVVIVVLGHLLSCASRDVAATAGEGGPQFQIEIERINRLHGANLPVAYDVRGIDISSDGETLVAAWPTGVAKVWELETGKVREVRFEAPQTQDVATPSRIDLSPDDEMLVTGSITLLPERGEAVTDHAAHLWHLSTGKKIRPFEGHADVVYSAMFSADGRRIVTASGDGTARVWDATTGRQQVVFKGHAGRVLAAVFSPNGTLVASGGVEGLSLWAAETGKVLMRAKTNGRFRDVAFSADGKLLAAADTDGSTVRVWRVPSGEEVSHLETPVAQPFDIEISAKNGQVLTVGADDPLDGPGKTTRTISGKILVSDPATGRILAASSTVPAYIMGLALAPDGDLIATSDSRAVRLWRVRR